MKIKLFLPVLMTGCGFCVNGQSLLERLEPNTPLANYSLIIQQGHNWNYHYLLQDGYVDSVKVFYKEEYRTGYKIVYDSRQKIRYEIMIFNINEGIVNDTIERYDINGHHIDDAYLVYEYGKNGLLSKIQSRSVVDSNKRSGWEEEYIYDKRGALKTKIHTDFDGEPQVQTARFKYDKYNNDGVWTEKYSVVDGKKTLVAKRVLKGLSDN